MSSQTPVVLILFNRPDTTERVFESIRQTRPDSLWVIGDGARPQRDSELEKVRQTRAVIDKVDWPCDVRVCFSESNMGCRDRVASGLKWVFEQTEQAVFLEDDCLPDPTFYSFCEELLDRYRDDHRVGAISGDNFQNGISRTEHSYYFSKYFHCWGWASWRRVWQTFDVEIKSWPTFNQADALSAWADSECEHWYWQRIFEQQHQGTSSSWAFSWLFNCWNQNALTILPDANLVSNIGFNEDGTHCSQDDQRFANLPTIPMGTMDHPDDVYRNVVADRYTFGRNFYRDSWRRKAKRWTRRKAQSWTKQAA